MSITISLPTLLLVLSLLPLLAYPAVIVANVMQLAALANPSLRRTGEPSFSLQRIAMGAFLIGTTAYPAIVLACRLLGRAKPGNSERVLILSAAPLIYLAFLAILLHLVLRAEGISRK